MPASPPASDAGLHAGAMGPAFNATCTILITESQPLLLHIFKFYLVISCGTVGVRYSGIGRIVPVAKIPVPGSRQVQSTAGTVKYLAVAGFVIIIHCYRRSGVWSDGN